MWTLPLNNPMTIRRIEKPLRAFVEVVSAQPWAGDRLSITIRRSIVAERDARSTRRAKRYDLHTGFPNDLEILHVRDHGKNESYWVAELIDGEAAIIRRYNGGAWGRPAHEDTVAIYVGQLWRDEYTKAQLDVARDAVQQTRVITPEVYRIAKDALPRAHGLFIALVRKELNL